MCVNTLEQWECPRWRQGGLVSIEKAIRGRLSPPYPKGEKGGCWCEVKNLFAERNLAIAPPKLLLRPWGKSWGFCLPLWGDGSSRCKRVVRSPSPFWYLSLLHYSRGSPAVLGMRKRKKLPLVGYLVQEPCHSNELTTTADSQVWFQQECSYQPFS